MHGMENLLHHYVFTIRKMLQNLPDLKSGNIIIYVLDNAEDGEKFTIGTIKRQQNLAASQMLKTEDNA